MGSLLFCSTQALQGQSSSFPRDTLPARSLDEVVVTATRNERKISNVAVPVSVISRQTIERAGSLRLRDILQIGRAHV